MRPKGYYWIKIKEPHEDVAHWEIDKWYIPQHNDTWQWSLYLDSDILEIDERRIEREPSVEEKNAQFDIKPPNEAELKQYISDNHYICNPD